MTLYFTGAAIKLCPPMWMNSKKVTTRLFALSVAASYISVLYIDLREYFAVSEKAWHICYFMVSDSNKLFAFLTGTSAFLFFKNLDIKHSKIINKIAATTFGVLLIHANSNTMRQWLWKDLLNISGMYEWPLLRLITAEVTVMVSVFAVCSVLDLVRIQYLERPVMEWLYKNSEMIEREFHICLLYVKKVCVKAGIITEI